MWISECIIAGKILSVWGFLGKWFETYLHTVTKFLFSNIKYTIYTICEWLVTTMHWILYCVNHISMDFVGVCVFHEKQMPSVWPPVAWCVEQTLLGSSADSDHWYSMLVWYCLLPSFVAHRNLLYQHLIHPSGFRWFVDSSYVYFR